MEAPEPGVDYPIQLGSSFLGERGADDAEYCTLRYDFKPASAGRASEGQLDVQPGNQKVSLTMGDAAFTGRYEPSRDGLDCVAIFDGASFRLELLGASVKNLRYVAGAGGRAAGGSRGSTPQPVAAAAPLPAAAAEQPAEEPAAAAAQPAMQAAVVAVQQPGCLEAMHGGEVGEDDCLESALMAEFERDAAVGEGGELAASEHQQQQQQQHGGAEEQPVGEEMQDEEESGEDEVEGAEEEEEEDAQQGASPPAAARTQQQHPVAAFAQPLLAALPPALDQAAMTEDERLFFGLEGSPEPPPQQAGSSSEGGEEGGDGGGSSGSEGGGPGSEAEQEDI